MSPDDRRDLSALVEGVHEEVANLREELGHRLIDLEHVRVRALEDWRLSVSVLETERARVASEAAETAAQMAEQVAVDKRERFSRRDALIGVALICLVTLLGALIASSQIRIF